MNEQVVWQVKRFHELTIDALYAILHLRSKVFVLEQDSPYLDLDYCDQEVLHLIGAAGEKIVGYSRLFIPENNSRVATYGRVIVAEEYRGSGLGHALIDKVEEVIRREWNVDEIHISAQLYLQSFYESHGYRCVGRPYDLECRLHVDMTKIMK